MENTLTTTAAQGAAKRANPIKNFISAVLSLTTMVTMAMASSVSAFAEGGEGVADGEAAFNSVIGFFATWIGRIGLVVAFVGGIMFALAIKNDDAEAKTRGLMTLASGFVVFALTLSLDLFGITG